MSRSAKRAALVHAFGVLLLAEPASAEDAIAVATHDCPLDAAEVERLVRLELASVLGPEASGSYSVELKCVDKNATIALFDPLTSKKVERVVTLPPPTQPERERLLALSVAQLYRAAWLELAADDPPPLPSPAGRSDARPAEKEAAKRSAERVIAGPEQLPKLSFALLGGASARRLEAPLVMPTAEIEVAYAPTGALVWLKLQGGIEWATFTRVTGAVDTLLGRVGAGVGLEPLTAGIWSGFTEIEGGLGYLVLRGSEVSAPYRPGMVEGPGFDGSVALGAAARAGPIRFELLARLGMLVGTPAGRVAGDDEVSLDGASAGAALRLRGVLPI